MKHKKSLNGLKHKTISAGIHTVLKWVSFAATALVSIFICRKRTEHYPLTANRPRAGEKMWGVLETGRPASAGHRIRVGKLDFSPRSTRTRRKISKTNIVY